MSRGVSDKTKKITLSAVLSAMGVVLLIIGSFVEVLDLSMAAMASFLCIFSVIEMGRGYPWMIYAVTAVLSIILFPQGLGGWFYLLFFGYYPIIKESVERLKKPIAWIIKILVFNCAITIYGLICYFLFFSELEILFNEFSTILGGMDPGVWLTAIIYIILNLIFVVYDIALTNLITLYVTRLRRKFKFLK